MSIYTLDNVTFVNYNITVVKTKGAETVGKIIIKETLDAILKKDSTLTNNQYIALLTRYQMLRESYERNKGSRFFIPERDNEELKGIIAFLFESCEITREQREMLWGVVDTIRAENA